MPDHLTPFETVTAGATPQDAVDLKCLIDGTTYAIEFRAFLAERLRE